MTPLLEVEALNVRFAGDDGPVAAVSDVSFTLARGECLGVVGESGSGKSQTFLAALGLTPANGCVTGRVMFDGQDLLTMPAPALRRLRGDRLAMIFQDSGTSLTPHMKVGKQLMEVLMVHRGMDAKAARAAVLAMFGEVRVPEPERRFDMYPHEFSGGMRQRAMIAMALLCKPDVLIADEPTTALDVTVQAQILSVLRSYKEASNAALVLITHDLGVVAGLSDRVMVMYGGRVAEEAPTAQIFATPRHPYTAALLRCRPSLDHDPDADLAMIPGAPPDPRSLPAGCAFGPRCEKAVARCGALPHLKPVGPAHQAACHMAEIV